MLLEDNPRNGLIFTPVVEPKHDGAFFSEKSHELLRNGNFARVPLIVGYNSLEVSLSITGRCCE